MSTVFDFLKSAATLCGFVSAIVTAVVLLVRPFRERVFNLKQIVSGMKCLLRSDMLRTYYKNKDAYRIRQHEMENFCAEYKAYKALGGNSFIDAIKEDVEQWEVIS